jgi:hypothetical protein
MHPPSDDQFAFGANFVVRRPSRIGHITQSLQLVVSPIRSGFCLDPYELAFYTGSTFVDLDSSPRAVAHRKPPSYVWGMFQWSEAGRYLGQGFTITVAQVQHSKTQQVINDACVADIAVAGGGGYRREEK